MNQKLLNELLKTSLDEVQETLLQYIETTNSYSQYIEFISKKYGNLCS